MKTLALNKLAEEVDRWDQFSNCCSGTRELKSIEIDTIDFDKSSYCRVLGKDLENLNKEEKEAIKNALKHLYDVVTNIRSNRAKELEKMIKPFTT